MVLSGLIWGALVHNAAASSCMDMKPNFSAEAACPPEHSQGTKMMHQLLRYAAQASLRELRAVGAAHVEPVCLDTHADGRWDFKSD